MKITSLHTMNLVSDKIKKTPCAPNNLHSVTSPLIKVTTYVLCVISCWLNLGTFFLKYFMWTKMMSYFP